MSRRGTRARISTAKARKLQSSDLEEDKYDSEGNENRSSVSTINGGRKQQSCKNKQKKNAVFTTFYIMRSSSSAYHMIPLERFVDPMEHFEVDQEYSYVPVNQDKATRGMLLTMG
ncbi:unnamed protein product, partial [Didymodactylos carnosus]